MCKATWLETHSVLSACVQHPGLLDVYIWAQIANTHQGVAFICMVLLLLHFVDFCYCMLRRFPNSNNAPAYQGL